MNSQIPKYDSFPDYIIGITEDIWEGRGIHLLHDYYTEDILVRSPAGVVRGNKAVIDDTRATICQFPDRQLLGEDVVWAKTGHNSWYSSHRIISKATHAGDGAFGSRTGTRLLYRTIADCHAEESEAHGWRINDEWLIRDQGAIVRQLGKTPRSYAAELIMKEGGRDQVSSPFRPSIADLNGPYKGTGNGDEWAERYAGLLESIMQAEMSAIARQYDRACQLELPEGVTTHGRDEADRFWMSLRASFPSAKFQIHNKLGRTDENMPARASVRWSLTGTHDGFGKFGAPTGANVYIMGLSQAEFGPRGIAREFILIDTTMIWKQILMHAG